MRNVSRTIGRAAVVGVVLLGSAAVGRGATLTYGDLVERLTDMEQLAVLPPKGEKTELASSYDRASQFSSWANAYLNWDANNDGRGIVRREGESEVLMDVQGPGCIWRIWSATPGNGRVKIFLDGATEPTVDLPFSGYFDGKTAPFNRRNLVYLASKAANGWNNYTPISFQKSCKIVADKDWGQYYQFTYTRFAAGTTVPTFSMKLSDADNAALDAADEKLGKIGPEWAGEEKESPVNAKNVKWLMGRIDVDRAQTKAIPVVGGPAAITDLNIQISSPDFRSLDDEGRRKLLRQLAVRITFDDAKTPSVWAPLGDFFGYVGGADAFRSLPVGMENDGTFYAHWYMPFAQNARIEFVNDSLSAVSIEWVVSTAPLSRPIESLGRFHAKWHRDLPAPEGKAIDWPLLTTRGRGKFVGLHLHGWNPRGTWWGEGDEKFFVDGETFPSTFGTGSEDYFGYAWSSAGHFSRPFHNQLLNEDNAGHFANSRWHVADTVPFETSFEAAIEKYYPNKKPTLYAATVFWYLDANGTDELAEVPVDQRVGYWVRPQVFRVTDALEGEDLAAVAVPPETRLEKQEMLVFGDRWSGEKQLLWRPTKDGDKLAITLRAKPAGKYRLLAGFTKAKDYGVFQLAVNGAAVGKPVNLYDPVVSIGEAVDLGVVTIGAQAATLDVTVAGTDLASSGRFFGLDYVKLVPVAE